MSEKHVYLVVNGNKTLATIADSLGVSSIIDDGVDGRVKINLTNPLNGTESTNDGIAIAKQNGSLVFIPEFSGFAKVNDVCDIISYVDGQPLGRGVVMEDGTVVADCAIDGETYISIDGDLA